MGAVDFGGGVLSPGTNNAFLVKIVVAPSLICYQGTMRDLYIGVSDGPDVLNLQQVLNLDPDTIVSISGPGSPGQETEHFGALTENATQRFQTKYNIVTSGTPFTTGFGRVGPLTRAKLTELYGCGAARIPIAVSLPQEVVVQVGVTNHSPILISDLTGQDVRGFEFVVSYNPMIVKISDIYLPTTISQNVNVATSTPGIGKFHVVAASTSGPLVGVGTSFLVLIQIDGVGVGRSDIQFDSFQFNEGLPLVSTSAGSVEVLPSPFPVGTFDLSISSLQVRPTNPIENQDFAIDIELTNKSTTDLPSVPLNLGVYESAGTTLLGRQVYGVAIDSPPIPANSSVVVRFDSATIPGRFMRFPAKDYQAMAVTLRRTLAHNNHILLKPFTIISGAAAAAGTGAALDVLSPNGGEVLPAGGSSAITWSGGVASAPVNLTLYPARDTTLALVAIGQAQNTGQYSWSIPLTTTPSSYQVRVCSLSGTSCMATAVSDEPFEITNPPPDTTPPTISNGSPSGTLPSGTTQAALDVATNENAICRWSAAANTPYGSMPNVFTTTGGISHSTAITGLQNGQTYSYYIRCKDQMDNANQSDFLISFAVASPPQPQLIGITLAPIGNKNINAGQELSFVVSATTSSGEALNFSVSLLSGAVFLPLGDVSRNGSLSSYDGAYIRQYISGTRSFTSGEKLLADVNRDGAINQADVDLIGAIVVGLNKRPSAYVFLWTPQAAQAGQHQATFTVTGSQLLVPASERITISVTAAPSLPPPPLALSKGPEITYFGIAKADGTLINQTTALADGTAVYSYPSGSGFIVVVEVKPGSSGSTPGYLVYNASGAPDLQIISNTPLGNGNAAVCEPYRGSVGGIPAASPFSLADATVITNTLNDFGCRFQSGRATLDQSFNYAYANSSSQRQYYLVVSSATKFRDNWTTTLQVKMRDQAGNFGNIKTIQVRIGSPSASVASTSVASVLESLANILERIDILLRSF